MLVFPYQKVPVREPFLRKCPKNNYICIMKAGRYILLAVLTLLHVISCDRKDIIPVVSPQKPAGNQKPVVNKTPVKLSGGVIGTGSSGAWAGLDFGKKHVVTKVGYSSSIVELAVFEGANEADFSDALPIGMIKELTVSEGMNYLDVNCSRGFRYVRCKEPNGARCYIADLEFYGYEADGDDSCFYQITNLPTVVINTENARAVTSKTDYIKSNVYIVSEGGRNLLSALQTEIRGRGNASWDFPKKPYKIKFQEKHRVLGSPSNDRKWTLINNYGDKTLMRNILAFEVSRRVGMAYTPFCTPVDVVFNGEYQGCYQLCDQVEVGTGRVEAKDGYLIEIDAYAYNEDVYFYSGKGMPVTVKYPKDDEITTSQLNFIKNYFGKLETALWSSNFKDPVSGYRKYLDVDSFLMNFIVGEFSGNTDTYWSVNMYKDGSDGVFYTGPAWDYDLAFENDQRTYPINNLSDYIYASAGSVASDATRTMVNKIVKQDPAAKARLVELWNRARPSLATLNSYVDETAALLDESQKLNFKRWPILNQRVHQNNAPKGSYVGEVNVVKSYITRRLTRFDELVSR